MKLIEGQEYFIGNVEDNIVGIFSHETYMGYYFDGLMNHPGGFVESREFPGKVGFLKDIKYVLKP